MHGHDRRQPCLFWNGRVGVDIMQRFDHRHGISGECKRGAVGGFASGGSGIAGNEVPMWVP